MNEEKYQNGDIYWNTYSGKFKMFDKDGNEIPYDRLEQTITRLEQENKALNFKINQLKANGLYNDLTGIELSAKVVELEQENKTLKELNTKICEDWTKTIQDYWDVLKEIRKIAKDIIKNDVYENSDVKAEMILDKINEVLDES